MSDTRFKIPDSSRPGFTLVEILVSIAILAIILVLGLTVSVRSYNRNMVESERDALVGILASARARALGNVNQSDHGVYIGSSSYVLFEGSAYSSRAAERDAEFPRDSSVMTQGAGEMVFLSPDGRASAGTITLSSAERSLSVEINPEGAILW